MALPDIWLYHPDTGILIGAGKADQSPADPPGIWLMPSNATDIEPPAATAGQHPAFVNGAWILVASGPPAPTETDFNIVAAPPNLFGGPTLQEVFNVNTTGH